MDNTLSTPEELRLMEEKIRPSTPAEYVTSRFISGITFGVSDILGLDGNSPGTLTSIAGLPAELIGFILGPGKLLAPIKFGAALKGLPDFARVAADFMAQGALYSTPKALVSGELGDIPKTGVEWGVMGGLGSLLLPKNLGRLLGFAVNEGEKIVKNISPEVKQIVESTPYTRPEWITGYHPEKATLIEGVSKETYPIIKLKGYPEPEPFNKIITPWIQKEVIETQKLRAAFPFAPPEIIQDSTIPLKKLEVIKETYAQCSKAYRVSKGKTFDTPLKVYRGVGFKPEELPKVGEAYTSTGSWTTDKNLAEQFAQESAFGGKKPVILEATLDRGIIGNEPEKEFFPHTDTVKIDNVSVLKVRPFTQKEMMDRGWLTAEGKNIPKLTLKDTKDTKVKSISGETEMFKSGIVHASIPQETASLINTTNDLISKIADKIVAQEILKTLPQYKNDLKRFVGILNKTANILGIDTKNLTSLVLTKQQFKSIVGDKEYASALYDKDSGIIAFIPAIAKKRGASMEAAVVHELTHVQTGLTEGEEFFKALFKNIDILSRAVKDDPKELLVMYNSKTRNLLSMLQHYKNPRAESFMRNIIDIHPQKVYKLNFSDSVTTMLGVDVFPYLQNNVDKAKILLSYSVVGDTVNGISPIVASLLIPSFIGYEELQGEHYGSYWTLPFKDEFTSVVKNIPSELGRMWSWFQAPAFKKEFQPVYNTMAKYFKDAEQEEKEVAAKISGELITAMFETHKTPKLRQDVANLWIREDATELSISLAEKLALTPHQKTIYEYKNKLLKEWSSTKIDTTREVLNMDYKWSVNKALGEQVDELSKQTQQMYGLFQAGKIDEVALKIHTNDVVKKQRQYLASKGELDATEKSIKDKYTLPNTYLMHNRTGDYVVVGLDEFGGVVSHDFATISETGGIQKKMMDEFAAQGVVGTKVYHYNNVFNDIPLLKRLPFDAIDTIIERTGKTSGLGLDPEVQSAIMEVMQRAVDPSRLKRKGIPGWRTDFISIFEGHENALMSAISSKNRVKGYKASLKEAENILDGDTKAYAQKFIKKLYTDPTSSQWKWMPKVLGTWFLALKPSFGVLNLTQAFQNNFSEAVNHVGLIKGTSVFGKAYKDTYNLIFKKVGVEKGLTDLFELAKSRGDIEPEQIRQFWEKAKIHHIPTLWNRLETLLTSIQVGTEVINRTHALSSAYRTAEHLGWDTTKMTADSPVYKLMLDFIKKTQFDYAKQAKPLIFQGGGALTQAANMAYMFKSYSWQMLHRMYSVFLTKDYKMSAKVAQALSLGMLGGALAVPGSVIYKKMMASQGVDIEDKMKTFIANSSLGSAIGDAVDDSMRMFGFHPEQIETAKRMGQNVIIRGFPSILNTDTAAWLGTGDFPISSPTDILGVLESVPSQISRSFDHYFKDKKTWMAIEDIAPSTIRNLMRGYRYAKEGVRAVDGELLYAPSTPETILRASGFPLIGENRAKEIRYTERQMINKVSKRSQFYALRLADAIRLKDSERIKSLQQEIMDWNRSNPPHLQIKVSMESLKYHIIEQLIGGQMGSVPKQLRQEVTQMRKAK